ncbi:putative sodium/hydrogen exchanger family protein [Legionella donaldsonii]|uniref:Putative sodium/hydrogen exchanger family protein n=1 Tax=Legionella donaldsonii TaxID=45060 RepID=A0A378J853_9GAMM|nr:cation:proton antiporter family protein [Legionella donaldsonii]STX43984.1 putative sodium/hydrogen exchanger family protein [Legionella donaldsonii]
MIDSSLIHLSPFYELTSLLILATTIGFFCLLLRQPTIVGFIIVGILVGPAFLGIIQSHDHIELLAELGIAVLLFLVGLKLDLNLIKTLGLVSLATGLGQVVFTSLIGFFIAKGLGMDSVTALYVSVALTFSSTIIIVKLLSDKHEADSLHGRIATGCLIVQDLVVVLAMMTLSAFAIGSGDSGVGLTTHFVKVFLYGITLLVFVGLFIRYLANPLVNRMAHSPELLIIFAIAWAALMAALGSYFGFSKELGGLIAGISLASTPIRDTIAARLSPLRDFLLLFFFIALGSQLSLNQLGHQAVPAILFSLFVLIGNPLIMLAIMGAMGYRKRTAFLAGLTVAQISEFSLVFMAMGVSLGHISTSSLGLVTLVGLITIALSVYMITYSQPLYRWLEPGLSFFERSNPYRENREIPPSIHKNNYDIVIFGLGRFGKAIAKLLIAKQLDVLAIDFNPDEVREWEFQGYDAIYGDACDIEFLASLPLNQAKWIICTIPQHLLGVTYQDPRIILTETVRQAKIPSYIAVTTHHTSEIKSLKTRGVDVVLQPFYDAATRAVEIILDLSESNPTKAGKE